MITAKTWLANRSESPGYHSGSDHFRTEDGLGNQCYIELTNMGDTALDLSQFMVSSPYSGQSTFYFAPNTMLDPGESYVLCNIWEEPGRGLA